MGNWELQRNRHINLFPKKKTSKKKVDDKSFDVMNTAANKSNVEKSLKGNASESAHAALLAGGFIPGPVGAVSDALDALLYLREGKSGQAILAGLSILPFGGALFRGYGKSKDIIYKSINVAGKRIPVKKAMKYVDEFERDIVKDFNENVRIVGGKQYKRFIESGVTPSRNILQTYTTTSARQAAIPMKYGGYGTSFIRMEFDPRVLKELAESVVEKGIHKGEKKLYKLEQYYTDVMHYVFSEGIPLNKVKDLKSFAHYTEYLDWLLDTGKITPMSHHKMKAKYRHGIL
jgi:hypothetical protein